MTQTQPLTWHEPLTYKWATADTDPTLLSAAVFAGVVTLIVRVTAVVTRSPLLGWPATFIIAILSGIALAYVLPFVIRFGNRTCSINEDGVRCDELVVPEWRYQSWTWDAIQYCVIKRVVVRRRTYVVLLIHTTDNEEHSMAINDEIDPEKVESAILRADCQLRMA